jgi:hypothetical protein
LWTICGHREVFEGLLAGDTGRCTPRLGARQWRTSTSSAAVRASSLNQPNTETEIRYSSRNDTVRDHGLMRTPRKLQLTAGR